MGQMLPEEPVILVRVRDLIEDLGRNMNMRLDEIDHKLDDRITKGVFGAVRSDLDAAIKRIGDLEKLADDRASRSQGVQTMLGWLLRFGGWLVATALGVAWLWITVSHG